MIPAAEINGDGIVVRVIVAPSIAWCVSTLGGLWVQSWVDGKYRGKHAGIGDTYDLANDVFVAPQQEQEDP
jgi:hypothetical protein